MLNVETKLFRIGKRVLSEFISIKLPVCDVHLLKGPNGCGKSLLLDTICGLYSDKYINILINGRDFTGRGARSRWTAGISRMFQSPTLPSMLTVQQVLNRFVLENNFMELLNGYLERCNIYNNRSLGEHSFGQQRFIELAIALSSGTYCLLDEPFSGLSSSLVELAIKLIKYSAQHGKAILIVDHLSEAHADLYNNIYEWKVPEKIYSNNSNLSLGRIYKDIKELSTTNVSNGVHWFIKYITINNNAVLCNASIDLCDGAFLFLVGGNGTGKSTILREMGGLKQPWEGVSASIKSDYIPDELLLSPQPPKLIGELSAKENLRYMLGKGGPVDKSIYMYAKNMLHWMGFPSEHLCNRAEVLSGGESGILALVGAILSPSKVLFLDEPFESFSSHTLRKAFGLLSMTNDLKKKTIISTHNLQFNDLFDVQPSIIYLSNNEAVSGSWTGTQFKLK